jgi:hypothetical protein
MAVILSMDSRKRLSVIPESGRGKRVMNLLNPNNLRVHFLESEAKNLALRIFMNIRDSSSPATPQNDGADEFFRSLSSQTTLHRRGGKPSVPQIPD